MHTPPVRIRAINDAPPRATGDFVLHWMIGSRRLSHNPTLDRALDYCRELGKPLLVFEPLRIGYRWASARLHRFIIEGMRDNQEICAKAGVRYLPYVEPRDGDGKGMLRALSQRACVVVTDDFPAFMLPHMIAAAGKQLTVRLEAVDANGILPMRATSQVFPTAYAFRRYLQKNVAAALASGPRAAPLARYEHGLAPLPTFERQSFTAADLEALLAPDGLRGLAIDHKVVPVSYAGGIKEARAQLAKFISSGLDRYSERNQPDADVASQLSPYLHFGHLGVHEVFAAVTKHEAWSVDRLSSKATGQREGFWNMRPNAEAFLDELITWREVGYNFCALRSDYDQYESLPEWARRSLDKHAHDPRKHLYTLAQFEAAKTHDPLWNAAQLQLVAEGRIHNYLRMLWGKKILEWSESPRAALAVMVELNNKYAVDGRNPNSYSGIFWTLGRYDRPWAPERDIFGVIRYMSSENTARKIRVKDYIARYSAGSQLPLL